MLQLAGDSSGKVKLSRTETNRLRKLAAKNGVAINAIETADQYSDALYSALPSILAEDMLAFFDSQLEGKPYQRSPELLRALEKPRESDVD